MDIFQSVKGYYSYKDFTQLMDTLVTNGQTSGSGHPELYVFYTKLNLQRMQRWDKTVQPDDELVALLKNAQPQIWWMINEAWCGDAAQTLPAIAKVLVASGGPVELRIIMRDENLAIMDNYLTNGGRSIPKLIATDLDGHELFNWGPRPAAAQKLMMDWKQNPSGKTFDEIEKELHLWYAKDKGQSVQDELRLLL